MVIPDSVITIEKEAFYYCDALESVVIGKNANNIGEYAFAWCEALINVELSEGVVSISDYMFYCCKSLKNIVIPNSIQSIGPYAFIYCENLTSITFSDISTWYTTNNYDDWQNRTGGENINVSKASSIAIYVTDYYANRFWYKL